MKLTVITHYDFNLSLYRRVLVFLFDKKPIKGHFAVTRSLLDGFRKLKDVSFNYNPVFKFGFYNNVVVLSGVEELKLMIELKRKKRIKKILAGPNIVVRSNEFNNLLGNDLIDKVLVPSEWVKQAYIEDLPVLKNKIVVWAAGVDEVYFKPNNDILKEYVLIYNKYNHSVLLDEVIQLCQALKLKYIQINYGHYELAKYKEFLDMSYLMIFLSDSESQGIAVHEAWSMNVPTFVYQAKSLEISGKKYATFSSAPYLEEKTGFYYRNMNELASLIANFALSHFSPREVVLEKYTDKQCAINLKKLI